MGKSIIRRFDELGRIVVPEAIRKHLRIQEGDPMEIQYNRNGEIIIRPYKRSWEETVLEWWAENYDRPAMRRSSFTRIGDYTFCVRSKSDGTCIAGFAKRYSGDKDDDRIGKVAAFARTIDMPINELIGWKG